MRSNNFVLKAHFGDTGPNIHLNKSFKADAFSQKWSSGPLNSDLFLHFSTEAKISFLDWNRLLFCPYPTMISLVLDHNQKCSMTSEFLLSTTPMAVYNWVANYFMSSLLCCQSIFFSPSKHSGSVIEAMEEEHLLKQHGSRAVLCGCLHSIFISTLTCNPRHTSSSSTRANH